MPYSVKEIYYTLQGEGVHAGRPAVFLRFTGCNFWSGLEADRGDGGSCSNWCDTDFVGMDGPGGGRFSTDRQLAVAVASYWPAEVHSHPFVVCTGGEPLLQLDAPLVRSLHEAGFEIAIETNGSRQPPPGIDWICVSPKAGEEFVLTRGHELKLIYPQAGLDPEAFEQLDFQHFVLQPMDGSNLVENTEAAVRFCLRRPRWRLGLQTHKLLQIP